MTEYHRPGEQLETSLHMLNTKLTKKGNQNVDLLSNLDHVATNVRYIFWRQRGSDQDDHQRKQSDDETRIQTESR